MARALLVNPSYFRTYGSTEGGLAFPVYPVLGLSSIASAARDRGHEVDILDLSYRPYDPDLFQSLLRRTRPDVVGFTATTPLVNQVRDMSFLAKDVDPDLMLLAGGPHASALPELTLAQSALDAVVVGEGDFALADILDGRPPGSVAGVAVRGAGPTPVPALLEDLDLLPVPAWELYPTGCQAHMTSLAARRRPVTTIEFSRGCLFSCDFCASKHTMGRGYRKKSPERCADELVRLGRLGFAEATLVDDIFTSDNDWAAQVCEAIIERRPGVAWTCTNGIRVDSAHRDLFALMARAGCYRVFFGFESGNDKVLATFGKGGRASLDQGAEAVELARKAGIEPHGFFMVGLSGDSEESMADTVEFARRVRLDTMKCGICVPFPGTPMFHELQREGHIRTLDWDAYTVYNEERPLHDHPRLSWDQITSAFHRFYTEAYLKNPAYLWRRFRYMVRNREFATTLRYAIGFSRLVSRHHRTTAPEPYAAESRWRPLDVDAATPLDERIPPRARSTRHQAYRDGRVTLQGRRRPVPAGPVPAGPVPAGPVPAGPVSAPEPGS